MFEITEAELKRRLEHPDNVARPTSASESRGPLLSDCSRGDSEAEVGLSARGAEGGSVGVGLHTPPVFSQVEGILDDLIASSKPRKKHNHLTEEQKVVAGTLAHLQPQESVADLFNSTQPAVSMMARGLSGGTAIAQQRPNASRAEVIKSNVEQILDLSRDVVHRSLTRITDSKLDSLKATELAKVAVSVAGVTEKITSKQHSSAGAQVVVVAFQQRAISEYGAIDVPAVVKD